MDLGRKKIVVFVALLEEQCRVNGYIRELAPDSLK